MGLRLGEIGKRLAAFVLVWALVLPFALSGHSLWESDADCGVTFGPHVVTQIGDDQSVGAGAHCAVCHWLRATSSTGPVLTREAEPILTESAVRLSRADRPASVGHLGFRPTRAPPSTT